MGILPSAGDMTAWIGEVAKNCLFSISSGIGFLCIIVYMIAVIAMAMDSEEFSAKKYAIGSLITYFLSKAIIFLFI